MGNHPSSDGAGGGGGGARPLGRRTGSLGLSKAELDKRCRPSGLYPSCQWDEKAIRRLVGDGKLAARLKGAEMRTNPSDRECPICFLQYCQVNVTKCCQASICTECYLQVRPQREKCSSCPFCNDPKLGITVAKRMEAEEIEEREAEEQRAIEATIKRRASSAQTSNLPNLSSDDNAASGFGTSLEQNETVRRMRARSESMSSDDAAFSGFRDEQFIRQLSLTSDDRRALEREMREQLTHPLSQQIEAEAEERRVANVQEYYRTNNGRLREARAAELLRGRSGNRRGRLSRMSNDPLLGNSSRRDWNQIVDAFERGGNGEVQTLDDLVVLEAALILSMEHEARQLGTPQGVASVGGESSEFDAALHAREGFPLVHDLLSRRSSNEGEQEAPASGRGLLGASGRRLGRRSHLLRGSSGRSMFGRGESGMMLRGITEDEQMALAIAMSLRESENTQQASEGIEGQGEGEEQTEAAAGSDEASDPNDSAVEGDSENQVLTDVQTGDEPALESSEARLNDAVEEVTNNISSQSSLAAVEEVQSAEENDSSSDSVSQEES